MAAILDFSSGSSKKSSRGAVLMLVSFVFSKHQSDMRSYSWRCLVILSTYPCQRVLLTVMVDNGGRPLPSCHFLKEEARGILLLKAVAIFMTLFTGNTCSAISIDAKTARWRTWLKQGIPAIVSPLLATAFYILLPLSLVRYAARSSA